MMDSKKGEQADKMSLFAWIWLDPQLRVQSKKILFLLDLSI